MSRTLAARDTSIDAVLKFQPPRAGIAVRNVAMHLMPLVNGAQRQGILFRGYLCGIQTHHRRLGILLAHRRQSPVVGRWVEPVESTIDFYRRSERKES